MGGPGSTTITRALDDATRASLAAAESAYNRAAINQREVAPGVWVLVPRADTKEDV